MSGDIVNLRRARKGRQRDKREHEAEQNRRLFGRTKAEKDRQAMERERSQNAIEQHRREPEPD
jgi:hypothetical protein